MSDEMVFYNNQQIFKEHFRAFVYGLNGEKKLANSWDAFQSLLGTGVWFETLENVPASQAIAEEEIDEEIIKKIKAPNKKGK